MIQIKHYNHDFTGNYQNPWSLVSEFGDTNTDTTTWRPDISVARAQAGILSGKKLLYDFPDGKDTGEVVQTFIRSKGLDITEVETAEQRITQIIEDKKTSDKEKADLKKQEKQFTDNIQKLADSVSDNTSNSPDSTQVKG